MTDGATRLTAVSVGAVALAMLPLFPITETHGWFLPGMIAIGLVAMSGWALRREGAPGWLVPLAQLVVLTWWIGILVAADVAWWSVIPNREWLERLVTRVGDGVAAINEFAPPVPVEDGLLLIIVAGAGLVALGVDVAVFGLRRVPLAGLPLAVMFAISASVIREDWSWLWFALPAAGYLMLLIAEGRSRIVSWGLSARPSARHQGRPETDSLARSGWRAGVVAVAAAVAVPAVVPMLSEGMVGGFGTGAGGGGTVQANNPIADLKRDLERPDNIPILRYTTDSDQREYIRTAALDVFDGEEWQQSSRPLDHRVSEGFPWPPGLRPADEPTMANYEFRISDNFSSPWLPLVYPTQSVDVGGNWRVFPSTLEVFGRGEDVQGAAYAAASVVVDPDPADLRDAWPPEDPVRFQSDFEELLEVPDETRQLLEPFVQEAVGDATNPHEQAVALQSWFQNSGGFTYSLDRVPGTSSSALLDFLNDRSGYCEQYAATMAVMARMLGIPSRVAIGFTPGERQDDGSRLVRAHDAHAWPELYFPDTGWVRFEPTPGISDRTGSPPPWTQAVRDDDEDPAGSIAPDGPSQSPDDAASPRLDEQLGDTAGGSGGEIEAASRWPLVLLGGAVAAGLLMTPSATARAVRTRRWHMASGDAGSEAEAAWSDLRDAVRDAGLHWDPAATPRGLRGQLVRHAHLVADDRELLDRLVHAVERARYAAQANHVPELRQGSAALRRTLLESRSQRRRLRAVLWPAAVSDLIVTASSRLAGGQDWFDAAGERLRSYLPARIR